MMFGSTEETSWRLLNDPRCDVYFPTTSVIDARKTSSTWDTLVQLASLSSITTQGVAGIPATDPLYLPAAMITPTAHLQPKRHHACNVRYTASNGTARWPLRAS